MFQSSTNRLRGWLTRVDDLLADSPEDLDDRLADPLGAPLTDPHLHPHRLPLRWDRERRPGSVAARPAHCISPVRAVPDIDGRDRAGRS
jgi:hypothetical protein